MFLIPDDVVSFAEQGLSIMVGTVDAKRVPDAVRAVAQRIHPDRRHMTVHLPVATAGTALTNLRSSGEIAVTISRPADHRTYQFKGRVIAVRDADEGDLEHVARSLAGLVEALEGGGLPRRITRRLTSWPCYAVDVEVRALFEQTPGPGSGSPVARRA